MRASNTFQISDMSEEARGKTYDLRILHKLVSYVAPYKLLIIVAALISLIHTGVQLLFPYITKIAIDDYILVSKLEGLSKIVAIYFLALIVGAFLSFGMSYLMQTIGQYIIRDIRVQTFSHLQHLRVAFFDRNPVGKLVTRVTNDGEALNQLFTEVVFSIFTDIAMLIGVIIVMFRLDAKLSMIAFTVVPPLVIITNLFRIKARKAYREIRKWLAQLNVHLNETFIGIKVIKLFNQPQANYVKFSAENHKYYQATMQQVVIYGIFTPIISLLFSCGTALIIWYGGGEVLQHTLSLGTLVAFLSYIAMFFRPIEDISTRFDVMQSSLTACERIFALIDTKEIETEDRGQKTEDRRQITDDKGEIEFKNVWFYYGEPSASPPRQSGISASLQQWVLRDISFKVRAGEKIAIVGSTGAGKTSLINLLARF
ncbi:MAG: ATP-binding cassette domain-containing protein [Candidatus Stahlbacteria bacterium]|nr:ATP-binding cassette domain-containing protein [Candidatus Stahlbacteria bacterium]